ncbi:hypothetical protein FSO04_25025 [Paraburkholderia madseniana]|uniref:Uncharacterized protein n=2 Tax=Paraburkholderia madseniana TaxID=2599607 RepID=A0A6N6WB71_9BURK|nr:hypothetical protein FSO04_25025 [Paraburkholderia madseniana]
MSREQATKTLERICERLDACATTESDKPLSKYLEDLPGPVTAKRLWVAGSYARGAMTCGDLDLVMEVDNPVYDGSYLKRMLIGNPQRVSLYTGKPEKNSSHAEFKEAVPVWQAGKDWRAALAAIQPVESVARFDRPTDRIPFRLEQIAGSLTWAEAMLASLARDELKWRFVPLDEVSALVEPKPQTGAQNELYRQSRFSRVGAGVKKLLPYVLAFVRRFGPVDLSWSMATSTRMTHGSTLFILGAAPALDELMSFGVSQVVVMPHLNTRGPNGFWVIERGSRHPLVTAFEGCHAWVIADEHGVSSVSGTSYREGSNRPVNAVDIFQSQAEADAFLVDLSEGCPPEAGEVREVRHIQGAAFLDILASCDLLMGGLSDTVFTHDGWDRALHAGFESEDLTRCTFDELGRLFRRTAECA